MDHATRERYKCSVKQLGALRKFFGRDGSGRCRAGDEYRFVNAGRRAYRILNPGFTQHDLTIRVVSSWRKRGWILVGQQTPQIYTMQLTAHGYNTLARGIDVPMDDDE